MQELNRARHPVDKSSVRWWWDVEMVEGWGELLQARGATCVAFPAVERGERFGGWLQASILGFSQSCEERDSLGSKARCDRGGHPSRRTVPSEQAPPVYRSVVWPAKEKKSAPCETKRERNVGGVDQKGESWADRTIHEIIVVKEVDECRQPNQWFRRDYQLNWSGAVYIEHLT